jgi:drug/metabolite transporter superfamily protein YnfA
MPSKEVVLRLQKWIWVLIYGGLLTVILGVFLARADLTLARTLQAGGGVLVLIGVVLVYLRSRIKEEPNK